MNPYLGFLHETSDRYETLTYDLVELFRARTDHFIINLINLGSIRAVHFEETSDGQRLTGEGIAIFIKQFETELARRSQSGGLSMGEAIYAQCFNMRRFVCDGGAFALYRWGEPS